MSKSILEDARELILISGWSRVTWDDATTQSMGLSNAMHGVTDGDWRRKKEIEVYAHPGLMYHLVLDTMWPDESGYLALIPFGGVKTYTIINGKVSHPRDREELLRFAPFTWPQVVAAYPGASGARLGLCVEGFRGSTPGEAAVLLVFMEHIIWATAIENAHKTGLSEVLSAMKTAKNKRKGL